jgi:muconolactone delta-isomerase
VLFHVSMDVRIPLKSDPEKIRHLQALERERAKELQLLQQLPANERVGLWAPVEIL